MNLHSDDTVRRNMDVSDMNCTFLHLRQQQRKKKSSKYQKQCLDPAKTKITDSA